jgi:uncharacterized protein
MYYQGRICSCVAKSKVRTYMKLKFWCLLFCIFLFSVSFSQKKFDFSDFLLTQKSESTKNKLKIQFSTNELKNATTLLFIAYKKFISSQDANRCVFHPSCSVYSIESIQEKGILVGLLSTFDRLSRCHIHSPEKYEIHVKSGKLWDPVH